MAAAAAPGHASGTVTEATEPVLPPFVVLYDGVCGLCSRTVSWLAAHDRERRLAYAPLQGETAALLRRRHPQIPEGLDAVVFVDPGGVHLRSRALLEIARHLGPPWRWAHRLRRLPSGPLDLLYGLVARVRYRVWGRYGACRLPAGTDTARHLP